MRAPGRAASPALRWLAGLGVWAGLLTSCVPAPAIPPPPPKGNASWRMEDTGAPRYQLQKGQVASGATPFHRVAPVYPPAQLDACRPSIEVHALLVVDGKGKVGEARVADEAAADASTKTFIAAVRSAVAQWTFVPLRIRSSADTGVEQAAAGDETRAFSLPYVFRFECHEGQPSVSSDR